MDDRNFEEFRKALGLKLSREEIEKRAMEKPQTVFGCFGGESRYVCIMNSDVALEIPDSPAHGEAAREPRLRLSRAGRAWLRFQVTDPGRLGRSAAPDSAMASFYFEDGLRSEPVELQCFQPGFVAGVVPGMDFRTQVGFVATKVQFLPEDAADHPTSFRPRDGGKVFIRGQLTRILKYAGSEDTESFFVAHCLTPYGKLEVSYPESLTETPKGGIFWIEAEGWVSADFGMADGDRKAPEWNFETGSRLLLTSLYEGNPRLVRLAMAERCALSVDGNVVAIGRSEAAEKLLDLLPSSERLGWFTVKKRSSGAAVQGGDKGVVASTEAGKALLFPTVDEEGRIALLEVARDPEHYETIETEEFELWSGRKKAPSRVASYEEFFGFREGAVAKHVDRFAGELGHVFSTNAEASDFTHKEVSRLWKEEKADMLVGFPSSLPTHPKRPGNGDEVEEVEMERVLLALEYPTGKVPCPCIIAKGRTGSPGFTLSEVSPWLPGVKARVLATSVHSWGKEAAGGEMRFRGRTWEFPIWAAIPAFCLRRPKLSYEGDAEVSLSAFAISFRLASEEDVEKELPEAEYGEFAAYLAKNPLKTQKDFERERLASFQDAVAIADSPAGYFSFLCRAEEAEETTFCGKRAILLRISFPFDRDPEKALHLPVLVAGDLARDVTVKPGDLVKGKARFLARAPELSGPSFATLPPNAKKP